MPRRELLHHELANRAIDGESSKRCDDLLVDDALRVEHAATVLPVARVVDVAALLDVAGEETLARGAAREAAVRELVNARLRLGAEAEGDLHFIEQLTRDERLVLAEVGLSAPHELARVHRIRDDARERPFLNRPAVPAAKTEVARELDELSERELAGRRDREDLAQERRLLRMQHDPARVTRRKIVELGPGNVSHHAADPHHLSVFDVKPSSIADHAALVAAARNDPRVAKFLTPEDHDPAFHFEIPIPAI